MKRALTAALCLVALVTAVSVSLGDMVAPHLVAVPVSFRTTDLYSTLSARDKARARSSSGTSGYIDSTVYIRSTAAGADTTAPISLSGVSIIHPVAGGDSLIGRLIVYESMGAGEATGLLPAVLKGLDSIYVSVEVGSGGQNPRWTRVASLLPYVYAVADTTTGRLASWPIKAGAPVGTSNVGATLGNLSLWPLIRFIIINDYNTSTSCFGATWVYASSATQDNR